MCEVSKLKIHRSCHTPDDVPVVFIQHEKVGMVGICAGCWAKIANSDYEWGTDPKPTLEQIFSDEARFGKDPVLTEYKPHVKKSDEPKEEEEEY